MLFLIRAQGVVLIGDEPHYLIESISIGRFHTLNMNPGYVYAVTHHSVYPWTATPGPHLAAIIGQAIWRHQLYLPFHAIGLSVLLVIPMLFSTTTAVVTLIVILAVLATGLTFLVGEVSGETSPWRMLVAGLYLAPAFILATDQVFPDTITGFLMAIVIATCALIEVRRRCTWIDVSIVSTCLVALPWLDQKNVFFPIPLLVAFMVVRSRAHSPSRSLRFVVLPVLASLIALLALNFYEFGDLLGGSQRIELISGNTMIRAAALLFDRRQGLFVQLPIALLGVAGIWSWRKRIPVSTAIASFIVVVTIYGNATQPDSFGGTASSDASAGRSFRYFWHSPVSISSIYGVFATSRRSYWRPLHSRCSPSNSSSSCDESTTTTT